MHPKRYALTKLGGQEEPRRVYFRRDANCPVLCHVRQRNAEVRIAVPCWMVNISEDGCLMTSDHYPPMVEDVYIIIPGLGAKVLGTVCNQGEYTLNVQFSTKVTAEVVDLVARMKTPPKA